MRLTTGGSRWLHQGGGEDVAALLVWVWVCRRMGWPVANRQDESDWKGHAGGGRANAVHAMRSRQGVVVDAGEGCLVQSSV